MRRDEARNILRAVGPRAFVQVYSDLLEGRDQTGKQIPKIDPNRQSIRGLFEALVGPVEEFLPSMRQAGRFSYLELQEAVDSTAFPSATGVLIASRVIEAYNGLPSIGDQLVTVMQSKLKSERLVGFTHLEGPTEVPEGMPYQESGFEEKFVTTETAKKGRLLKITEETIFFDQTGQILLRASRLGESTREERELVILGGVLDVGGAAGLTVAGINFRPVYRPAGVATALYSAGNANLLATPTPLVDWTDIDEVFQYQAANQRDDRGTVGERRPILWNPRVLLVSRRLTGTAARILSATETRSQTGATDASMVTVAGNPVTTVAPGMRILSSALIDYLASLAGSNYDDGRDWLIGDPQRQFIWQEIWPLQTLRTTLQEEEFHRDIVAAFKVRYYGGIAALDAVGGMVKVNAV